MKILQTDNLTGEIIEVEVIESPIENFEVFPTDDERISALETLILQIGGII